MTALVASSAEAVAAYRIATGERLVRLDPDCPNPVTSAATVIRALRTSQRQSRNFGSNIYVVVEDQHLRYATARELTYLLSIEDSVGPISCGADLTGRMDPQAMYHRIDVTPPRLNTPISVHLLVVGLDPAKVPERQFRWENEHLVCGTQILIVGPERDWHDGYFEQLLTDSPVDEERVWGTPCVELLLAGGPR